MSVSFGPQSSQSRPPGGEKKGRFLVVPEDLGNFKEEDLDDLHRPLRDGRKTGRFEVHRDDPWEEPYPDELPDQHRIVVIGDIHGDYEALKACLQMSGCVSPSDVSVWTARKGTVMVVLGDVVDRFRNKRCDRPEEQGCQETEWVESSGMFLAKSIGETQDEEKRVLRLLNSLSVQAYSRGTYLYRLVGNHEDMQTRNSKGEFYYQETYASPFSVGGKATEDYHARWKSFYEGEFHELVGKHRPKVALKVGGHVFCHGGFNADCVRAADELSDTMSWENQNIIQLANAAFDEHWRNVPNPVYGIIYDLIVCACGPNRRGNAAFSGLLWDDSLSDTKTSEGTCSLQTRKVLELLEQNFKRSGWGPAKHIVISHCMQFDRDQDHTAGNIPSREVRGERFADFTTKGGGIFRKTSADNRTINALCEGEVWRVDVGMSRAFAFTKRASYRPGELRSSRPAILIIEAKEGGGHDYTVRQWNADLPGVGL